MSALIIFLCLVGFAASQDPSQDDTPPYWCVASNGTKIRPKDVFQDQCTTWRCDSPSAVVLLRNHCPDVNGKCFPVRGAETFPCKPDNTIIKDCRCVAGRDGSPLFSYKDTSKCIAPTDQSTINQGDLWVNDCVTYACNLGDFIVQKADCKDANGKCVSVGDDTTTFTYRADNGQDITNCKCVGEATKPGVACIGTAVAAQPQPAACTAGGNQYDVGTSFTYDCSDYNCTPNGPSRTVARCSDDSTTCTPAGQDKYKCQLNGQAYDSCICTDYGNGTVAVTAQ